MSTQVAIEAEPIKKSKKKKPELSSKFKKTSFDGVRTFFVRNGWNDQSKINIIELEPAIRRIRFRGNKFFDLPMPYIYIGASFGRRQNSMYIGSMSAHCSGRPLDPKDDTLVPMSICPLPNFYNGRLCGGSLFAAEITKPTIDDYVQGVYQTLFLKTFNYDGYTNNGWWRHVRKKWILSQYDGKYVTGLRVPRLSVLETWQNISFDEMLQYNWNPSRSNYNLNTLTSGIY